MEDTNYLLHYGVLGMKWGVRKDRRRSNSVRSGSQKRHSINKTAKSLGKATQSKNKTKKPLFTPEQKQKIKQVAKSSAVVAGKVAAVAVLGSVGYTALNEISREANKAGYNVYKGYEPKWMETARSARENLDEIDRFGKRIGR